jgi:xylose isomerase
MEKSYHSICAWTFNSGKGGFTPPDIRKEWDDGIFDTINKIKLIKEKIAPRLPSNVVLGFEAHYDYEYNEKDAERIADALTDAGIYLAMATPGAHRHFAYGGICSPDKNERDKAVDYAIRALDIVYGPLKKAWLNGKPPSFVIWNGSFGYDLATVMIKNMYDYLKLNVANLCKYEQKKGGKLFIAIEPKPNEGHPAMLIPTVASAIVFWKKLSEEYKIDVSRKGVNKEFGHSEMIGLDHVYDTVEEIDNDMLVHMHVNSQGYNDGILLGGPGKFDIDNGVRVNGYNVAIAGLIRQAGYNRWKGHDMQPRAYDNEEQAIDRVIRSILSWEACEMAADYVDYKKLNKFMEKRETAKVEDLMRDAVCYAQKNFDRLYE